jgi:hypothetical protein
VRYQVRSIGLLPPKPPPPTQLSLTARSRLDALWARVRVPFDATDAEHAASLRALYALAFPDLPPLQEVRVSACVLSQEAPKPDRNTQSVYASRKQTRKRHAMGGVLSPHMWMAWGRRAQ